MRICSLLPSSTEIIYALGLQDHLVAVTHECDFPPEAGLKPRVTRSEITPSLSSAEIDFRVRQQLQDVGTLYHLDAALLEQLQPDVIFTQQLCTVCSVSYDNVYRIAQTLSRKPLVINLEPHSLEGIFDTILAVGNLAGESERADFVVAALKDRLQKVQLVTAGLPKKKVLCLEWIDPPFCAGHWIPELVEIAGGRDDLGRKHQPSKQVAWEKIIEYNPDVIIVMCCGFSVERSLQDIAHLKSQDLSRVSAIQSGQVFAVDGSSYFSRPGPRIVDSAEILATIIHPELFPFDYPGTVVRQADVNSSPSVPLP